ncbi:MAG: M6 family metalloprotease domain-containing protein [Bryobacteraceae bacterium]
MTSLHRIAALATIATTALATSPPRPGTPMPDTFRQFVQQGKLALSTRGLVPWTNRTRANRAAVRAGTMSPTAAAAAGGTIIEGTRQIPVLAVKFKNTGSDPFPIANLQKELFDGPWSPGTMTDFYKEISYGRLTVNGTVFPWKQISQNDTFYEAGCNGLCGTSKVPNLLKEALDLNDGAIDFAQYDNDGKDGIPNSGDDDGFVDFVAFVHPEAGGECGNSNIWSHRSAISDWTGSDYTTNDAKHGGGFIKINDYVIQPAFACDGSTMIQIGVFSHEFGHAFGLPDLYDTDSNNGTSAGLGAWCLMASGSWGGDNQSPERPTHMSAWAKEFLGWIDPTEVGADIKPATIGNMEDNPVAFKIAISPTQYYLISNRQKAKFDQNLPIAGLMVQKINQTVIDATMSTNKVNADETNPGVALVQADGNSDLENNNGRGDSGDLFPGSKNRKVFDSTTSPKMLVGSICNVAVSGADVTADLVTSAATCATGGGGGGKPGCSGILPIPGNGSGDGTGPGAALLIAPALVALVLLALRKFTSVTA